VVSSGVHTVLPDGPPVSASDGSDRGTLGVSARVGDGARCRRLPARWPGAAMKEGIEPSLR